VLLAAWNRAASPDRARHSRARPYQHKTAVATCQAMIAT
jgi:hypothetical protein